MRNKHRHAMWNRRMMWNTHEMLQARWIAKGLMQRGSDDGQLVAQLNCNCSEGIISCNN